MSKDNYRLCLTKKKKQLQIVSKVNYRQYIKKTSTGCRVGQDNHRLCVTRQLQTVCDKTTTVCDKATTDCV